MRCHILTALTIASAFAFARCVPANEPFGQSSPAIAPTTARLPAMAEAPQPHIVQVSDTTLAQASGGEPASSAGESWRFRRHQDMWWYWLPSDKWVYWHDGRWIPYDAASYAELRRSMPVRQYSYYRGRASRGTGGYPELGEWGPIRYDSYGNRQYPYSMRRSGIRQLGPVPAMGGVRSLPGWGGER